MIRISNLPLPLDGDLQQLRAKAAALLHLAPDDITECALARQSIDARKKSDVHYVCTVNVTVADESALSGVLGGNIACVTPAPYVFPAVTRTAATRPVVVGMGPAGLFSALYLARNGVPVLLLERGRPVEERVADVEGFWKLGMLNPESNVQFGEGGAGAFSDGKLTTGIHDPRIGTVLASLAAAGAPADILYQQKPHIGTDVLRDVVRAIREELRALGCEIRFGHRVTGLQLRENAVVGVTVDGPQGGYDLPCDALVLAPGHSARDTFRMLAASGVPLAPKPFAIGVRIEHSQRAISEAQFGASWQKLPPADYKLSCHLPDGRSAYTFCVCPGGQVVAAASEPGHLVVNGMSSRARDGERINGGFLVGVSPADFEHPDDPLSGLAFQEHWEAAAFRLGGGSFRAPAQTVSNFLSGKVTAALGAFPPSYRPGVVAADLSACLPDFVTNTLRAALPLFDRKLRGFAVPSAVMTGVETRSSSPVRILRDEGFQSPVRGLYPCGEGAGYAGGIVSAAVDGIRVAEAIATAQA